MQILRAKPEDATTLTKIAFAAKRHWGYPERWIEGWRDVLTIRPDFVVDHETHLASEDGQVAGFYSLMQTQDRIRLEHLWVSPDAMGRGIGQSLFLHAVGRMKALGCKTMEIESDPNAAGFYERMGALRAGTVVTQLDGQPRELPVLVYQLDPLS
jgi:ribosomal protein S18 acetylase RimI-like enzyme